MIRSAPLCMGLMLAVNAAAQPVRVQVDGQVRNAGIQTHVEGTRLAEAVLAAAPGRRAFPQAAVLTRRAAQHDQLRLKAGLQHDLDVLGHSDRPAVAKLARELAAWLEPLSVTGRVVTELSPRRLEVTPEANLPLRDGDRVHYPTRPTDVRIVGAVVSPCVVAHVPMQDALAYARACPAQAADKDWLFVVQPDGRVQRIGIAPWNRSELQALAPGAVVFVPLPARALRDLDGDFNAEFAAFLGTQPVDAPGVAR